MELIKMKYTINIDYIDDSKNSKTAKLSLLDENNKKLLSKVPVSLPSELFHEDKVIYYYELNNKKPDIIQANLSGEDLKALYIDNEAFKPLFDFSDPYNPKKTFNANNDEYVSLNKRILFFPQFDDSKLGIDTEAFIMKESHYNVLKDALKNNSGVEFNVKRSKFNLFNSFEDRNLRNFSDINKVYTISKQLELKRQASPKKDSLAQEKIREKIRERLDQKHGKKIDIPEPTHLSMEEAANAIRQETQKTQEAKSTVSEQQKEVNSKMFLIKDNTSLSSKMLYEVNKDRPSIRSFDYLFLLSTYNYFVLQDRAFKKENILNAFKNIPGGEIINSTAFVSNENGFFIQFFEDENKKSPLGSLSFDYENKTFLLQNSESKISLSPSVINPKSLHLDCQYPNMTISGELFNLKNDRGNNISEYLTIGNMALKTQNQTVDYSFGAKYKFDILENLEQKLNYNMNENNTNIDLDLIYKKQKEQYGSLIDDVLTNLNVNFQGRNPKQFEFNKNYVGGILNESDLPPLDTTIKGVKQPEFESKSVGNENTEQEKPLSFDEQKKQFLDEKRENETGNNKTDDSVLKQALMDKIKEMKNQQQDEQTSVEPDVEKTSVQSDLPENVIPEVSVEKPDTPKLEQTEKQVEEVQKVEIVKQPETIQDEVLKNTLSDLIKKNQNQGDEQGDDIHLNEPPKEILEKEKQMNENKEFFNNLLVGNTDDNFLTSMVNLDQLFDQSEDLKGANIGTPLSHESSFPEYIENDEDLSFDYQHEYEQYMTNSNENPAPTTLAEEQSKNDKTSAKKFKI